MQSAISSLIMQVTLLRSCCTLQAPWSDAVFQDAASKSSALDLTVVYSSSLVSNSQSSLCHQCTPGFRLQRASGKHAAGPCVFTLASLLLSYSSISSKCTSLTGNIFTPAPLSAQVMLWYWMMPTCNTFEGCRLPSFDKSRHITAYHKNNPKTTLHTTALLLENQQS